MATRTLSVEMVLRARDRTKQAFGSIGHSLNGITKTLLSLPSLFTAAFSGVTLAGFVRGILNAGAQAEQLQTQFSELYGSIEKGQRKIDEIKAFGRLTIGTQNALAAALQLKQFGIEPLDGALQSLADQNAKLGGRQENLMEISRQLGQAWQKQKLQYEEILILMERGVPVLELLSSATGKSAQEITELASKGQLGRDAIKALFDEMRRVSAGAAAAQFNTFNKLVDRGRDLWERFKLSIANSGAFDAVASRLRTVIERFESFAEDGSMERFATAIGQQMVRVVDALEKNIPGAIKKAQQSFEDLARIAPSLFQAIGTVAVKTAGAIALAWEGLIGVLNLATVAYNKIAETLARNEIESLTGRIELLQRLLEKVSDDQRATAVRQEIEQLEKQLEAAKRKADGFGVAAVDAMENALQRTQKAADIIDSLFDKDRANSSLVNAADNIGKAGETAAEGIKKSGIAAALAQRDLEQWKALLESGVITQSTFDQYAKSADQAKTATDKLLQSIENADGKKLAFSDTQQALDDIEAQAKKPVKITPDTTAIQQEINTVQRGLDRLQKGVTVPVRFKAEGDRDLLRQLEQANLGLS